MHIEPVKERSSTFEISDEILLGLYTKGDIKALNELIVRYKKPLYSFLWRLVASGNEVDELFQETWLRVIQKSESFEQYRFKGWIFKIAYNLVIDWSRTKRKNLSLDQTSEYADGLQTLGDTLPATGFSPDGQAANADLQIEITQALASLPVEQREVFVMRMEADMSFKEIAEIQGISINTALARMQYALTKMRKALKPLHENSERTL
ncbi:MAG: sigma-70 family RNA polymerase sigma factor [bacterium]|jgi:RNA polymerase sigma-70 factor (ECF subfamily)